MTLSLHLVTPLKRAALALSVSVSVSVSVSATLLSPSVTRAQAPVSPLTPPVLPDRALESADAQWFIAQVNRGLRAVYVASSVADWANLTDLTPAHEAESAARSAELMAYVSAVIPLAARFDDVPTDPQTRRQLTLLKRGCRRRARARSPRGRRTQGRPRRHERAL